MESLETADMDDSEEELKPNLIGDDDSDEDDDGISEEDDLEEKHASLLNSINALSSKEKKVTQRTIASTDVSEFGFTKYEDDSQIKISDLISSLNASAGATHLRKRVKAIQNQTLEEIPLLKPQQERLTRSIAYNATAEEVSKWQPLIQKNRKAEQLTFPLQQPNYSLKSSDEMTKRFQARTPLEREIAMLLHGSDNVEKKTKMLTKAEERALKAMSLEEARERRAELMKFRALMTYSEVKFRRQKKIKSKRFHKIMRKEKLKKEEKELDSLQKTDPESYLEKLEYVDKARVEERMSLKHRGGSKFARKKMMYARYDPVARQAIQDMIDKNKELTKKPYVSSDESDDNVSMDDDEEFNMISAALDSKGDNPWMKAPTKPSEFTRPKKITQAKKDERNSDPDSEEDDPLSTLKADINTDVNLLELEAKRLRKLKLKREKSEVVDLSNLEASGKTNEDIDSGALCSENDELEKRLSESLLKEAAATSSKKSRKRKSVGGVDNKDNKDSSTKDSKSRPETAEDKKDIDALFNILEHVEKQQAIKKLTNKEKRQIKKLKAKSEADAIGKTVTDNSKDDIDDGEESLSHSTTRKRTMEEYEGNWSEDEKIPEKRKKADTKDTEEEKKDLQKVSVDPKKLFTMEPDVIKAKEKCEIVTNEDDEDMLDDDDDQRMTIAQAFADDDVIEEFQLEKRDDAEKNKPKDIDLVLPGWGDWGGEGIVVSKRKTKKFTIKKNAPKRKDSKMGYVILNEKKDTAVAEHQVKDLPRKFLNTKQFEQSIRQPIGNTWNPEKAFHRMIQPKVVTQKGAIIRPIDKEEMFKKQKINRKAGGDFDKERTSKRNTNEKNNKRKLVKNPKK